MMGVGEYRAVVGHQPKLSNYGTLVRLWLQRVPAIGLTHTTTNRVSAARPLTVFVLRARRGSGVEWKERRVPCW
jgi:hypothetical protein